MPRLPIDYSKTIIYKLCCLDTNITDIYIGHTTNWTDRKRCHKKNVEKINSNGYNIKVYQFIREHGGWNNWSMIQVEEYQCNNRREADARETYWIKELKPTLNCCQSFTTEEEHQQRFKKYRETENGKNKAKEYAKTDKRKLYQSNYTKTEKMRIYHMEYKRKIALYLNELKCFNL